MRKRFVHVFAICLFAITMLGASSNETRVDRIGHKLVCQCGCGQILMECNHVGCPVSPVMIEELKTQVASGLPETGVLNFFIAKYGPISLAAPIRGGFDNVAWIVPFAVCVLATFGVAFLIRYWKKRNDSVLPAAGGAAVLPSNESLQDRIRRDTDYDNWELKIMDAQSLIAPIILVIACFAYVFWPQPKLAVQVEKTRLDYLRERKEVVYEILRDLNFEYRAGKYPEEDYAAQRSSLEDEAATVIAEMDTLGG